MSAPNPFMEGISDAVGFVGGALAGYWAGQWLGLNIFSAGYDNASIGGILLVGLGGGMQVCTWPVIGAANKKPKIATPHHELLDHSHSASGPACAALALVARTPRRPGPGGSRW